MDMNILKYMAFLKTVECGSFTKAAELLNYSQSGISRMINDLEKEWHVTLLRRSRAGVLLTADGTRLLPQIKRVCDEYTSLQTRIDELNGLQSGLIRIGTISSVATHWLPNIMQSFKRDYPKIDYEILLGHYGDIEHWINDGRVDLGFLRLPADSSLDSSFLEQDELMAVLPENHPLAQNDKVCVSRLSEYPFILLEKGAGGEISELFRQCGVTPQVKCTTLDDYAVMSMVEKGLGISILPPLILRRVPYQIVMKSLDIPAYRNLGFAVRDRRELPLSVSRFLEYIKFRNNE